MFMLSTSILIMFFFFSFFLSSDELIVLGFQNHSGQLTSFKFVTVSLEKYIRTSLFKCCKCLIRKLNDSHHVHKFHSKILLSFTFTALKPLRFFLLKLPINLFIFFFSPFAFYFSSIITLNISLCQVVW